ncbi:MAG: branched-chain amino acid ABC transporter ATP-binding protein/permease [Betaproteobacteria bacterium]|nr:branched-chain amino acid ABC transporter ATP-binding protein/permease [Betaproteobacteria bacterium]
MPLAAGFGLLAALALGSLYALPALRVQGYYLGFVTLSVAMVFPELLVSFNDYTNGINGITRAVPALNAPLFWGLTPLSFLVIALTSAALAGHAALRATRLGRHMRVAAVSPEAAQALGFSPGHVRSAAFVIAAFGTGLAGILYVPVVGFLSPSAFHLELSIFFFFSVIVGGRGRLLGPILGVWILYLVPNVLLVDLVNYRLIGYGLVALTIMLLFPDGLVGSVETWLRRRRQHAGGAEVGVQWIMAVTGEGRAQAARAAAPPDAAPVVAVETARKSYGQVIALDNVDLKVVRGRIHGLVGPNGSGKTTLLNVISGFARLDQGRVRILDQDTTRLAAWRIARLGVGRTFQTPRVFDDLSIRENLQIGADFGDDRGRADWLFRALADAGVGERWRAERPDLLPHAQRRLLEVLRVIAMDSSVLLLDEPAAGLSPEERRDFAALLRHLRDALGKTIILVEHDLDLVWRVADRITVLDAGAIVAEGAPDQIVGNPKVRALFTGKRDA